MTTATPWQVIVSKDKTEIAVVAHEGGRFICDIVGNMPVDFQNAHLVAAAPELLEALELLLSTVVNQKGIMQAQVKEGSPIAKAQVAIAKARAA